MGETFTVNPVTGTASLTVPVPLSPGRGGATPSLALSYDSGRGNGPFGLGWALSLPTIARRTDKRLPLYEDDRDVFVLAGAEDLVPVGRGRYRPRVESHESRIQRDGAHWSVTSAANETTLFGISESGRIADGQRVFEWLPQVWRDDRGNITEYEWTADGSARLLTAVRYANPVPFQPGGWLLELLLDYEDRPDPHSTCRPGFEVRLTRRCARMRMVHHFPELPGPATVRSLELSYQGRLLTGITTVGWNGDVRTALPTLEMTYTPSVVGAESARMDDTNTPAGLSAGYDLVDLDGEGLAGILAEQGGAWYYRRNLGGGRFAAASAISPVPSPIDGQLLDLDGDGRRSLVSVGAEPAGHFGRTDDGSWAGQRGFDRLPRLDWTDKRLRMADLDGDGRSDVLILGDDFAWYQSRGRDGYDEDRRTEPGVGELLFHDESESVQLVDMSGDGLPDLVRVRPGEVCYWPGLGYGRFGAKVTMDGVAPLTDPRRVRLVDLDGTGPADLVLLDDDAITLWFNESGNGFGEPKVLPPLPHLSSVDDLRIADLFGTGTACLVWSSPLPGEGWRYVDLMREGRPNLLRTIRNGFGLTTTLSYSPSTHFYLADEQAGRPWHTPLPFVVQCLSRVLVEDQVSGQRKVTEYAYHHGYFDRVEREFRGFAHVDQVDAESGDSPGILTRQWFHTGVDPERGDLIAVLERDWHPTALALGRPQLPEGAERTLRGRALRSEVFAADAPEVPYRVTQYQPWVRAVPGADGVFDVQERQRLEHNFERDPSDPRVAQRILLEVDDHGVETRSAQIWYPRKSPEIFEQETGAATLTSRVVANVDSVEAYRTGILQEAATYELLGLQVSPDRLVTPEQLDLDRRIIDRVRVAYWSDDLSRALPYETYVLALTPQILELLDTDVDPAAGGYVSLDGDWWMPSARPEFDAQRFFLPIGQWDPFGAMTTVRYDGHALMPVAVTDPVGNTIVAEPDYRALGATRITDANGDVTEAVYDALGRLAGTAMLSMGDSLAGFEPDPGIESYMDDPLAHAAALLGNASSRILYDTGQIPAVAAALERERHADPTSPIRNSFTYTDGFGREAMRKLPAEPGAAPWRDHDGTLRLMPPRHTGQRWTGTGRTIRNANGLPVRRYEPFFSPTHRFETEPELVEAGVTVVLRYDPLGRTTATLNPDGSRMTTEFSAWRQLRRDENGNPAATLLDVQGRDVRVDVAGLVTRTTLDVEGNRLAVTDPRGIVVLRTQYDLAGMPLRSESPDSGVRRTLSDVAGKPMLIWTARGQLIQNTYDPAQRPLSRAVDGMVVQRWIYGEDPAAPAGGRLKGRVYQVFDEAGTLTNQEFDAKGNLLRSSRRVDSEEFFARTAYDALNRVTGQELPGGESVVVRWNAANLLDSLTLTTSDGTSTDVVRDIAYDAKGQRTRVEYGSGAVTVYDYDPLTFRLKRLRTKVGTTVHQDLTYDHDAVGNILGITDTSAPFHSPAVPASARYVYDALYRLVEATGRENIGQSGDAEYGPVPHFHDGQAMRRYTERFGYDDSGNLTSVTHVTGGGQWRRHYVYAGDSNRLLATGASGYSYDDGGAMTRMPHLNRMAWDHDDRLAEVTLAPTGGAERIARYRYGHDGQRVTKAIIQGGVVVEERIYLGGYEIHRSRSATGALKQELRTLHLSDGPRRVALAETRLGEPTVLRYQHDNHLGSSCVELDAGGQPLTYEEFYPFGATSYQTGPGFARVSLKRYRYTGKEHDEETGLYHYGARYYAAWLGRWTSPDPSGADDGPNLYQYVGNNPIRYHDPNGRAASDPLEDRHTAIIQQVRQRFSDEVNKAFRQSPWAHVKAVFSGKRGFERYLSEVSTLAHKGVQKWAEQTFPGVTANLKATGFNRDLDLYFSQDKLGIELKLRIGTLLRSPEQQAAQVEELGRRGAAYAVITAGTKRGLGFGEISRVLYLGVQQVAEIFKAGPGRNPESGSVTPEFALTIAKLTGQTLKDIGKRLLPGAEFYDYLKYGVGAGSLGTGLRLTGAVGFKAAFLGGAASAAGGLAVPLLGIYGLVQEAEQQLADPVYRDLARFLSQSCRPHVCHNSAPNHLQQPNYTHIFLSPEPR